MVLVMEYAAGGELYDFLSERKVLAEEEARRIFRQIATAVYYCHKVSIHMCVIFHSYEDYPKETGIALPWTRACVELISAPRRE